MMTSRGIRSALIAAGVTAAVVIFSQVVLKSPLAVGFLALVLGLLNGLLAAGLILIYRSTRIINFAQSTMGALGGAFTFHLVQLNHWPFWAAFIIGMAVSALVGMALELLVIRRFFNAPRLGVTVLTIALAAMLSGFASTFVRGLPLFPEPGEVSLEQEFGRIPLPFPNFQFEIGRLSLQFGFGHVFALVMSLLALGGLGYFLRFTRLGTAIRASAQNAERAELLGIRVKSLSTVVWTIAGTLAGLGVILNGSVTQFASVSGLAPAQLVPALAAALLGRMRSISTAVGAAILMSLLREAFRWNYEAQIELIDIGTFAIVLLSLLVQRRELERSEAGEVSSWRASEELRSTPKELLSVGGITAWRIIIVVGLGLFALLWPWVSSTGATNFAGFIAITAIIILSLVVLTGWAGQVSLGQYAFVAIGAVVGGALTARTPVPFWLALPLGALITAAVAVLVGIPALRIKGLFLAVATLAFAFAVESVLFKAEYFGWLLPDRVDRPTLFLLDFEDERSMYYLVLGALLVCIAIVSTLRRFRTGRAFIGVRDNENNMRSFGVRVVRTKLAAFAISGFLCGFAGVLMAHHQRAVTAASFTAQESLNVFLFAVVGGITSVTGTLLGTTYFAARRFVTGSLAGYTVGPLGTVLVLYLFPTGLAGMLYSIRDGIYRIVAQRRQLIVPSLMADYDPRTVHRRLIPIIPATPESPSQTLLKDERYRQPISRLYFERGRQLALADQDGATELSEEAAAIGLATKSLETGPQDEPKRTEGPS